MAFSLRFLLVVCAFLFGGLACSSLPKNPVVPAEIPPNRPQWTVGERYESLAPGACSMRISIANQRLALLDRDGQAVLETDCSTGKVGKDTPKGVFRVLEKIVDKRSNLYGSYVSKETGEVTAPRSWLVSRPPGSRFVGTPMPYWMRLTWAGVGIHVGGFERGTRTSMGCIRVPAEAQRLLFAKARVGTRVVIE